MAGHWASCCIIYWKWTRTYSREVKTLAKPDLLRNLSGKDTLLSSVLNIEDLEKHSLYRILRLDLQLLGETRGLVVIFLISWDNSFTGVWAGGDIPTGSAAVWRSRGSGVFFFISWDNPFTGVWAGGDIPTGSAAVCMAEPEISSISHETIPLQEYERAMIFRLGLLLSGGARDFFYISWDNLFTGVWASGDIPTGSAVWRN